MTWNQRLRFADWLEASGYWASGQRKEATRLARVIGAAVRALRAEDGAETTAGAIPEEGPTKP
jgi:hypothetical protein